MGYNQLMKKEEFVNKFWEILFNYNTVTILSHQSPDEDALSSLISLKLIILNRFPEKIVRLLIEDRRFSIVDFLEGYDEIEFVKNITKEIDDSLLITIDANEPIHISKNTDFIENLLPKSINIDHHPQGGQENEYLIQYRNTDLRSCTAVLYELFLENEEDISKPLARALLTGIIGDSNKFNFIKENDLETVRYAYEIAKKSRISFREIYDELGEISEQAFEALRIFVSNHKNVRLSNAPDLSYSFIDVEDIKRLGESSVKEGKVKYTHNFLRYVMGYNWGFTVREGSSSEEFIFSLRSKPGFPDVEYLAKNLLGGGGHRTSSGGSMNKKEFGVSTPEQAAEKFIEMVEELKELKTI